MVFVNREPDVAAAPDLLAVCLALIAEVETYDPAPCLHELKHLAVLAVEKATGAP